MSRDEAISLTDFLMARIAEDEEVFARWDPTRVLAECKAKRVAVEWYLNDDDQVMGATVEAMAAVYADHPDYRADWGTS